MSGKKKIYISVFLSILLIASLCLDAYFYSQLTGIGQHIVQTQDQLQVVQNSVDSTNKSIDAANQELQ